MMPDEVDCEYDADSYSDPEFAEIAEWWVRYGDWWDRFWVVDGDWEHRFGRNYPMVIS